MLRFSSQIQSEEISTELNLTPLIDIVFLLLIFFMLSTTFIDSSRLKVELPKASSKSTANQKKSNEVRLAKNGEIELDGKKISLEDLEVEFKAISSTSNPNLILRADKNVKHGSVVKVMDVAQRLGITTLSIAVEQQE